MDQTASVWTVLLIAAVTANLPFVNDRLLAFGPVRQPKRIGWRMLELLVMFALTVLLGLLLESRQSQRAPQGWEFYAVFWSLFLTLAFPGFAWRYLYRHSQR